MAVLHRALPCIFFTTLVVAQVHTHIALPLESYSVTADNRPTPAGDEVLVQTDSANGDVTIFPGQDRINAIRSAHENCGDNFDEACLTAVSKAWGFGAGAEHNGLSKRMPTAPAQALISLLVLVVAWWLGKKPDADPAIRLPKEQLPTLGHTAQPTNVYKTASDDPNPVTVVVPTPTAAPARPPSVTQNADGSLDITLPEDDVAFINDALDRMVCKRSTKRQDGNDAWTDCIALAVAHLEAATDPGARLENHQWLEWVAPDAELGLINRPPWQPEFPAIVYDALHMISRWDERWEHAREAVARFEWWIAEYHFGYGEKISSKMHIPYRKKRPVEDDDDDDDKCSAEGRQILNCMACGGPDMSRPVRPWDNPLSPPNGPREYSNIWKCKGRASGDGLKACECFVSKPPALHRYDGLQEAVRKSNEVWMSPRVDDDPTKLPERRTYCNKQAGDVRSNTDRWRWGEYKSMKNEVDTFCSKNFEKDRQYGPGPGEQDKYEYGVYAFRFKMSYEGGAAPSKEQCKLALMEILDSCDADPVLNPRNEKWGGHLRELHTGRTYEVIPTERRVEGRKPEHECHTWKNREQKGYKGQNGKTLPEDIDDKMLKLSCIHRMRQAPNWFTDPFACGDPNDPFYKIVLKEWWYESLNDCWNHNYPCIEDSILNQGGVVMTATHWAVAGGSRCWVGFDDY